MASRRDRCFEHLASDREFHEVRPAMKVGLAHRVCFVDEAGVHGQETARLDVPEPEPSFEPLTSWLVPAPVARRLGVPAHRDIVVILSPNQEDRRFDA